VNGDDSVASTTAATTTTTTTAADSNTTSTSSYVARNPNLVSIKFLILAFQIYPTEKHIRGACWSSRLTGWCTRKD
jgi:hypothetical protein